MGVIMGINSYMKAKEAEKAQKVSNRRMIAGGPARGGSSEYDYNPLTIEFKSTDDAQDTMGQTQAGALARNEANQPKPVFQREAEANQNALNPFLLDAPPAFRPPPEPAQPSQYASTQPPPATQPQRGRALGLLSENLGVA
jgi:hypothetical protein